MIYLTKTYKLTITNDLMDIDKVDTSQTYIRDSIVGEGQRHLLVNLLECLEILTV